MKTVTFYNIISPFYSVIDLFLKPQKRMLIKKINDLLPSSILEVGGGSSFHILRYKSEHRLTVIDISTKMLRITQKKAKQHKYYLMEGERTSFAKKSFDCVVMCHVLSVTPDPQKMLDEAHRLLKPNGVVLILNHFTPDNLMGYFDSFFGLFSSVFHFKSPFKINTFAPSKQFDLEEEISIGKLNYYKLLILRKK